LLKRSAADSPRSLENTRRRPGRAWARRERSIDVEYGGSTPLYWLVSSTWVLKERSRPDRLKGPAVL
jgi:hypothetical protein